MTTFKHFFINEDGSDEGNDDEVDHGDDCQVHHLVAEIPPQDDEGEEKDIWSVKTLQELQMLSTGKYLVSWSCTVKYLII